MRIRISRNDLSKLKADLAVCFAYENDKQPRGVADAGLRRELGVQMKTEEFDGHPGDLLVWNANGRYPSRRFLVVGLGSERKVPGEAIRQGCGRAARAAAGYSARTLALRLPGARGPRSADEVRAAVEGAILGAYQFDRLPDRSAATTGQARLGRGGDPAGHGLAKKAAGLGEVGARAVCLARDLVNEAPSRMTPKQMARDRRPGGEGGQAALQGNWVRTELRKIGMRRPARGRPRQPGAPAGRPADLQAQGTEAAQDSIVLVGKGVTFDSGGLNLKPGDSMLTMKCDMAGAAAVLATMTTLPAIGCRVEVHGFLGLTENMTGAAAYKPGDILETYSGKTVEVGNTDAEGRLVLCDLMAYANKRVKPTHMVIDVATLTGACVVALGTRGDGTVHPPRRDARRIARGRQPWQGRRSGRCRCTKSTCNCCRRGPADLRNVGGRWGGAITAALFLGEFLPRELPWAHLDVAGPAFTENELPDTPAGATGAAVLTLMHWLQKA